MGVYLQTVSEFRAIAEAINPTGRFLHGRMIDASQQHHGAFPIIVLYPFQIRTAVDPEFIDSSDILIGFFMQDRADTSPEERETIIGQMDDLCDAFMAMLDESSVSRYSGVIREPQYQLNQATQSGFAVRFSYQNFQPC